jgi:hypothetical protein
MNNKKYLDNIYYYSSILARTNAEKHLEYLNKLKLRDTNTYYQLLTRINNKKN